jgi:nicotinamidase/pyrazinamidase
MTDRKTLIVTDVQNDFCPGGGLPVEGGDEVVPLINRLLPKFDLVVLTQDWHPPDHSSLASNHPGAEPFSTVEMSYGEQVLWPDHCIQGSRGAQFHPELETNAADLIVRKGADPKIDSYSAFFENDHATSTGLAGYLRDRGAGTLYLAGLATDFCVRWSAVDAAKLGFSVVLVEDACRAINLEGSLTEALREMKKHGVSFVEGVALE